MDTSKKAVPAVPVRSAADAVRTLTTTCTYKKSLEKLSTDYNNVEKLSTGKNYPTT
jgi:hypothetical protein